MVEYKYIDGYNVEPWISKMTDVTKNDILRGFADSGVLPQRVSKMGIPHEVIDEAIICDSISGGADYENDMPRTVSLVRKLKDGTEYRARYIQVSENGDKN